MKKLLSLLATFALVLTLAGCGDKTPAFEGGTFTGTAKGFGGDIEAKVTLDANKVLTNVVFTGEGETEGIGSKVVESFGAKMVELNQVEIDVMAGATISSNGCIAAATSALEAAGLKPADLVKNEIDTSKKEETVDADIVVVGAGGAGMVAAIKAAQAGQKVVIMDKAPIVGGNTSRATGGMNAAMTPAQLAVHHDDSIELFIEDTMVGGHNLNNPELVSILCNNAKDEIAWLETIGAKLPVVGQFGGASVKRIHKPEGGSAVGSYLVPIFESNLKELNVPMYLETEATELIVKDGAVVGVKANSEKVDYTFNGAVILATGGFAANKEMCAELKPSLKGFGSTNVPFTIGDGIKMATAIGASTVDMEQIQIHPTVNPDSSKMITEGARGDGAILVNTLGKRFFNELDTRDAVSAAELAQPNGYVYLVFSEATKNLRSVYGKYTANAELTTSGATLEELASKINVPADALKETVDTFVKISKGEVVDEFGRDKGFETSLEEGPYYAIKVSPALHHTMGGLKINTNAEVISTEGNVIPGLFAAGEVTGGVHGGNRLGGNAVTDIVVFGSVAANSAVNYTK